MHLQEASFVVVDTETTGGRASTDRLIEIAAVRVENGAIADCFQQLINPQCTIPRRITWLTGISTAMVYDQPSAEEVLPGFLAFLKSDVFVAHNLIFDLRFVNGEQARIGKAALDNETLCTLRLARRLLPGLRSRGLGSLADFYGIRMERRHRALDDAQATAEILIRFLDQMNLEFGIDKLSDVLSFQYRRYADVRETSRHVLHVRRNVLARLPERPGVYFMKDQKGKTIYIGKARNLSTRVRSYFISIEGHPPRIRRMVKSVREIEWEVTDSELEAMLLESRLIKEHRPSYNRAQKQYVNRPFIRIDTSHDFPRVAVSAFLHDDGCEYYGPMSSRHEAAFVVDVIDHFFRLRECDDATFAARRKCVYASMGRCVGPCEDEDADYGAELARVQAFLSGRDQRVMEWIESAMRKSASALDFEQAGIYRDWLRTLDRLLGKQRVVARRVLNHNAVIIHRPDSGGAARLLVVCRGRHVETLHVEDLSSDVEMAALEECLMRRFPGSEAVSSYREKEIDEIHLLSQWLFVHRDQIRQVHWHETKSVDAMVRHIRLALESIGRPSTAAVPTKAVA